jgi:hypothetical protein
MHGGGRHGRAAATAAALPTAAARAGGVAGGRRGTVSGGGGGRCYLPAMLTQDAELPAAQPLSTQWLARSGLLERVSPAILSSSISLRAMRTFWMGAGLPSFWHSAKPWAREEGRSAATKRPATRWRTAIVPGNRGSCPGDQGGKRPATRGKRATREGHGLLWRWNVNSTRGTALKWGGLRGKARGRVTRRPAQV